MTHPLCDCPSTGALHDVKCAFLVGIRVEARRRFAALASTKLVRPSPAPRYDEVFRRGIDELFGAGS